MRLQGSERDRGTLRESGTACKTDRETSLIHLTVNKLTHKHTHPPSLGAGSGTKKLVFLIVLAEIVAPAKRDSI